MIYIRYVHIYMSMYLFQWNKSHYTKRNHMCFNIYIWDSHPFVVQVGFEFIWCSRNVKRKHYSVCLVIVLLIINIIWYTVYSIYCDIIYETRRWIHAQEGMQISWRKTYSFFQCYAHKYKRRVFVVKIIELSPPFDTVRDWIHRYLCWFIQWLASFGNHSTKNIFYIYIISTLELLWTIRDCINFNESIAIFSFNFHSWK